MNMDRRTFLKSFGLSLSYILQARIGKSMNGPQPNFIVIMLDDCSTKEFGCYGHDTHQTPHIDNLARAGVMFKTCWATPICSPSRAQLMTGRFGFRTLWYHNNVKPGGKNYDLADAELLFSEFLKTNGYKTAIAGKWQLGAYKDGQGRYRIDDYGFDEHCLWCTGENNLPVGSNYDGYIEGKDDVLPGRTDRYWHPAVLQNGELLPTTESDYGPDIYTDFILDFAKRQKENPFFIYYPMCLTHLSWYEPISRETGRTCYVPVPEVDEFGQRTGNRTPHGKKYNVEYVDQLLGRIVNGLKEMSLFENTIIMFTSDNGTAGFGKGVLAGENGCLVPMIVSGPRWVKRSGPSDELVQLADVFPTMVDFSGAVMPAGVTLDGVSFAPYLQKQSNKTRDWIFSYYKDRRFLRDKRWLLDGYDNFWDCGDNRSGTGYRYVTDSNDPEVVDARKRFENILLYLPAPDPDRWFQDIAPTNPDQVDEFRVYPNYPNPFNTETIIQVWIPSNCRVELDIYDMLGHKIRTLVKRSLSKGEYRWQWDGRDDKNKTVASGIYIYRLKTADKILDRKLCFLR
jgi:arylsulfatase A-like enzyme